jgi:hypothetical protein
MRPRFMSTMLSLLVVVAAPEARSSEPIVLEPQPGAMQVTARVPALGNQAFALGIPETIGCREAMLVNFPEAKIDWQGPDEHAVVSCSWGPGGRIAYSLRLVPAADHIDVEMTIRNHTEFLWRDVFAFNCINPIQARKFHDWKLQRTYMSRQGKPFRMSETTRVQGHMPTVGFYLPEHVRAVEESVFVRGFGATSPDRTDGSWIVTLSEPAGSYMAATAMEVAFLFDNLDRCCIHAAPSFGDIGLTEPEVTTPEPGDAYGGDHAAKYETSIALALDPTWVQLDRLTPGRDPEQVTLPDTPRKDASTHDPTHPLYAIHGQDPRRKASKEFGEKLVHEIVTRLAEMVTRALGETVKPPKAGPRGT